MASKARQRVNAAMRLSGRAFLKGDGERGGTYASRLVRYLKSRQRAVDMQRAPDHIASRRHRYRKARKQEAKP